MTVAMLGILSLAATASLCGWGWYQYRSTATHRPAIAWTLGGLTVGILTLAVIWAVDSIAQKPLAGELGQPVALDVPWPAGIDASMPSDREANRQVITELKRAQDATKRKDFEQALAHVEAARLVRNRTARHDHLIAQFLTYLHVQRREYEPALNAIRAQLAYPDLQPAERTQLLPLAAQLAFQARDLEAAVEHARGALSMRPDDRAAALILVQALYLQQRYDELLPTLRAFLDRERAADREIDVNLLRMLLVAEQSRGADLDELIEKLASDFPEHRDALHGSDSRRR